MSAFQNPPVIFTQTSRHLDNIWIDYGHEIKRLPMGWIKDEGRRMLPCDIIWEKDVEIRMRDGTKLFGDVFRPAETEEGVRIPAIMPWSPYGKTGTGEIDSSDRAFDRKMQANSIQANRDLTCCLSV